MLSAVTTPHRLGLRALTALLAIALAGTAAACSEDSGPAGEPSAAPTSAVPSPSGDAEETEARTNALAAYNGFREAHVAASTKADSTGGDLPRYTADPLLSELRFELMQKNDQGLITKGKPTWNAKVAKINVSSRPFSATIEDCFDGTGWDTIFKSTGKPAAVPGQTKKYLVTAEAAQYDDGRWLIRSAKAERERPC